MIRGLFTVLAVLMIGVLPAWAADFDHAAHLTYIEGSPCSTCHEAEAKEIIPDTKVCLECHDQAFVSAVKLPGLKTHGPTWALEHRPFAKGDGVNCSSCHQQDFCLECHKSGYADEMGAFDNNMINVHRSDFHVTHPIAARTNPQLCSSCHESKFCQECHEEFAPADLAIQSHRRGWSDLPGVEHALFTPEMCQTCHPNSVLPSHQWASTHAREARKNLTTCQACHPEGDICLKCHSARSGLMVNPHPKDWNEFEGRMDRASGNRTCRKCH